MLTEVLSNPAALLPVGRVSLLLTSVLVFVWFSCGSKNDFNIIGG